VTDPTDPTTLEPGELPPLAITWRCHVCGRDRPDELVRVYTEPIKLGPADGRVNVRYCADRAECVAGAPAVAARWREAMG
jgi:hypothetical protein